MFDFNLPSTDAVIEQMYGYYIPEEETATPAPSAYEDDFVSDETYLPEAA